MFATFFLYSTTCSNNCFIKMTLLIKKSSQELITHSKNIFYRIIISRPLKSILLSDIQQYNYQTSIVNLQVFVSLGIETCRFL